MTIWANSATCYGVVRQIIQPPGFLNFVTDFGGIPDGITSNITAMAAFNAYGAAQTNTVNLYIPPGAYAGSVAPFDGIKSCVISGYSATWLDDFWIGPAGIGAGGGIWVDDQHSPRIQTVSAGSITATLVDKTKVSLFSVNQWVLVTALDIMGIGYPPNLHYNEYIQINSIDAINGILTFKTPLVNGYKSTYPSYFPHGNSSPVDMGGPATIYSLQSVWDIDLTIGGMSFGAGYQGRFNGRSITLIDCNFSGFNPAPTITKTGLLQNCKFSKTPLDQIEVDKLITSLTFKNCTNSGNPVLKLQSTSVSSLIVDNCVFEGIAGGARDNHISNSTMNFVNFGVQFGRVETINLQNNIIFSIGIFTQHNLITDFAVSSGTLSIAKSTGPVLWAVPGQHGFEFGGAGTNYGSEFTVTDVREFGTNTLVDTTLVGNSFPRIPTSGVFEPAGQIGPHAAVSITASGNSGCPDALDLNHLTNKPLFSYNNRTYEGNWDTHGIDPSDNITGWGNLVRITINVQRAYTGSSAPQCRFTFGGTGLDVWDSLTLVQINWAPVVDLKIAGTRIITPGSVVGAVGADNIPVTPAFWCWGRQLTAELIDDTNGDPDNQQPLVVVTVETDQHLS